ncbi:MAG TPA: NDP-sugar synthase [Acidimicrobiales bacterium]|nr:NDP-sugar synthase [Acidimicrobiales bacterium]
MRAVVLVGGLGTRLRPLTHHRPKQMLPIVNRPMIEHVVGHLVEHGVDDVVLSLGYQPDGFRDAYPDGRCAGASLHYAIEPEPLDTAGAIRFAARDAGIDERFLVVNGDVLTDLDVTAFVGFHEARAAEGTISLHRVDDPSRYGVVLSDAWGRVSAFVEKPPRGEVASDLINAGTYVLEPSVIDRIPAARRVSVERQIFPAMAADGSLYARPDGCYWIDTGTPCEYIQAQLDLVDGVRGSPVNGIHPDARVADEAAVKRSVVGPGASVAPGARVENAVLLPGAGVCSAAVIDGSVIGEGAMVAEGAHVLRGSVVGDGEVVERGRHLDGERVPDSDF